MDFWLFQVMHFKDLLFFSVDTVDNVRMVFNLSLYYILHFLVSLCFI
jgi:hypothetical protein